MAMTELGILRNKLCKMIFYADDFCKMPFYADDFVIFQNIGLIVFIQIIKCDKILAQACFEQILWANSAYFVHLNGNVKSQIRGASLVGSGPFKGKS